MLERNLKVHIEMQTIDVVRNLLGTPSVHLQCRSAARWAVRPRGLFEDLVALARCIALGTLTVATSFSRKYRQNQSRGALLTEVHAGLTKTINPRTPAAWSSPRCKVDEGQRYVQLLATVVRHVHEVKLACDATFQAV